MLTQPRRRHVIIIRRRSEEAPAGRVVQQVRDHAQVLEVVLQPGRGVRAVRPWAQARALPGRVVSEASWGCDEA